MIKNLFTPPEDTQGAKKAKREMEMSGWGAKQQNYRWSSYGIFIYIHGMFFGSNLLDKSGLKEKILPRYDRCFCVCCGSLVLMFTSPPPATHTSQC